MSSVLDDGAIAQLLVEPKPPLELSHLVPSAAKGMHREAQREVTGTAGSKFRVIVRQLVRDPLDFSVILAYAIPDSNRLFRLRRHNGDSHPHTNKLEGTTITGFHVHLATERYQLAGFREDAFAEAADAYSDLFGAIGAMLDAAAFAPPPQGTLL